MIPELKHLVLAILVTLHIGYVQSRYAQFRSNSDFVIGVNLPERIQSSEALHHLKIGE